jgi:hypothetical protein
MTYLPRRIGVPIGFAGSKVPSEPSSSICKCFAQLLLGNREQANAPCVGQAWVTTLSDGKKNSAPRPVRGAVEGI